MAETFHNVLRNSFLHETDQPIYGGGGYIIAITNGSSENLIENNILWYGNKDMTTQAMGGGNVIAYNYAEIPSAPPTLTRRRRDSTQAMIRRRIWNCWRATTATISWGQLLGTFNLYHSVSQLAVRGARSASAPEHLYEPSPGSGRSPYGDYSAFPAPPSTFRLTASTTASLETFSVRTVKRCFLAQGL